MDEILESAKRGPLPSASCAVLGRGLSLKASVRSRRLADSCSHTQKRCVGGRVGDLALPRVSILCSHGGCHESLVCGGIGLSRACLASCSP
eukprot:scaffold37010_cov19-Tisochrysis_lutea.AAC.1